MYESCVLVRPYAELEWQFAQLREPSNTIEAAGGGGVGGGLNELGAGPTLMESPSPPTVPAISHSPRLATVQRHPKYFIDFVIFRVEDVIFKVPKNFLTRDSSLFETIFACPPGSEEAEGVNEARPIVLPDATMEEFEILMDFYHEWPDGPRKPDEADITVAGAPPKQKSKFKKGEKITDRLFTLPPISTRLLFDNARELVLKTLEQPGALSSFPPTEKIQLARKHDVDQWLRPAYTYIDLCQRPKHLEEKDVEAIGLVTVLLMAKARERY
ncbi:hypothetical protein FA13DRAFT_1708692 [Coprinellus micaceus]|uniref:BTB domain-containing protein n=1 Tax=Coprinellus micaceus TaxID=71717 RepID=A0A4Y7TF61_COPMI|nr:hypothetical protein FA13DRAFT_1708692 [Coprinellus micaceus]